jgi:hypothetical protein
VKATRDFAPLLMARGWRVYVLDERTEAAAFAACGIESKPTFLCVRRGVECGRCIGADWSALCAMLRRANERRFNNHREPQNLREQTAIGARHRNGPRG